MQVSLTTSISNYFESLKAFRGLKTGKFYSLLLFSSTFLLMTSDVGLAIVPSHNIAQAPTRAIINRPTLQLGSQGERVLELQAALKLLGFYSGAVDGVYRDDTAMAVSRFKRAVDLPPDGIVDALTWERLFPKQPIVIPTISSPPPPSHLRNNFPVPTQIRTTTTTRVANPSPPRSNPPTVIPQARPISPPSAQIPGVQYTAQGFPILRLGMLNEEVRKLQEILNQLGFLAGGVDGDFGPITEAAVRAAQRHYGLEVDGVVGGATWEALLRR
jgi:peptidoglycan hydrolase-like protein with peptidoglycan-binding domain